MLDTEVNKIDYKDEVCGVLMELPQQINIIEVGFRWSAYMFRAKIGRAHV